VVQGFENRPVLIGLLGAITSANFLILRMAFITAFLWLRLRVEGSIKLISLAFYG
jgi:hypothetical protein